MKSQPYKNSPSVKTQVLLVEDNPGDIRLMEEAVKEGALTSKMHVARDGEQAMAFLHHEGKFAGSPRPDFILLDLNLPRKSGREVLAEIKLEKGLCHIPVMILSTSTNPEDISRAYDLHATCYLQKPGSLEELLELCRSIECFWLSSALLAG
jgi:chemotaxis family two-component system response regulator Rcp1